MRGRSVLEGVRAHIRPTGDGHRVTSLELFFDLVFVYAITNISALMEHHVGLRPSIEGVVVLSIVWFGWCSYAWLGNQAQADEGLVRVGLVLATGGMFFVAISIPHVFSADSNAAAILVVAYAAVRLIHNGVYFVAAGDDRRLRSVVLSMAALVCVVLVPLSIGAAVDPHDRLWWWLAAVLIDQGGVYFIRAQRWRLPSASHFAERFSLVVLIAIGESLVGLGVATSEDHLTGTLALDLLCGLAVAVCLWWTYFDVVAVRAEHVLGEAEDDRRVRMARQDFTYLHLPMVGGVVFVALGLGLTIHHEHDLAGRLALYLGTAVYLEATCVLHRYDGWASTVQRQVVVVLLVVLAFATAALPVTAQLAVPALLLVALVGYETVHYRPERERIRHGDGQFVRRSR